MNQRECRKLRPTAVLQFFVVSGISKSHARVIAVGWLQRIPSDARMMKTHDRISLVTGPGEKIAMTNFVSTLCLVLLCSAIFLGSSTLAAGKDSGLDGTYSLDETDGDNMNEVIEDAVGKLNFLTRDIARGRLKKLNPVYRQVAVAASPNE